MSAITQNLFFTKARTMARATKRIWLERTRPRMISAHTLSDPAFLAKFNLDDVATFLKRNDISSAKKALLTHYVCRETPAWPALPSEIRDLCINTNELCQAELIELANAIMECRFVLSLNAPKVTLEGKIAWHVNPTSDPEWLWDLHRHEWWAILGLAYARTRDERYAAAFVNVMLDWIKENLPPPERAEKSPSWRLMEVGLRMRFSWIPCFALFLSSPTFTEEAKLAMLRSIYDHARFLTLFKTDRNHLLRESNGLACIGICFPEFKEADLWRRVALNRLDRALVKQVNQDGSHIEVSTGYQSLVIEELQNIYELLQANNLSLPTQNLASWLVRMYRAMAYLARPDGTFPQVNDGILYWDYSHLAKAGEAFRCDDLVYIGTSGSRGARPTDTSIGLYDAGLYVQRSDWSREARYLLLDAGPYGGPHGHEDKLSIEVFAFGQAFIVDSGTCTYHNLDPFRAYFVGSQGHNTVLVDGKSQIRRWRKQNLDPQKTTLGNYATWISRPDFDYVSASYNEGYSLFGFQEPEDAKLIKDVCHTRRILFVKPDYWVMVDEIHSSMPHDYQVLFHTAPEVVVEARSENKAILTAKPGSAALHLIPAEPRTVKLSRLTGSEMPIQGWYSAGWNHKTPATVVIYERENCSSVIITTLLYPCPAGQPCDDVAITPLKVLEGNGLAFIVTFGYGNDYLMLSQDNSFKRFGPYQSRGTVAGVRTDKYGNILKSFEH